MSETLQTAPHRIDWKGILWTPWTLVILLPLAVLALDPANFQHITVFAASAFARTLPYIIFAVILIAWLKAAGADTMIGSAFKGRETHMILLAALFGGLAPFCSCQVIPFIAGLLAVGVPLAPVMAFWLSSPLIDPPTLLITASALGWPFAIAKAVAAVGLGLMGGFAVKAMMANGAFADPLRERASGGCCQKKSSVDGKPVWRFWGETERRETFRSELAGNALFLVKWLALAYVLEALLVTYVPASLIAGVVGGDGLLPIAISAVVGVPAYLNAYVAPPLLAGLTDQGMSMGAAMAFIIAGGVSSVPAMAAVWSLVKPRVFAAYFLLGLLGAMLAGLAFQMVV